MIYIDRAVAFDYPRREMSLAGWACFEDWTACDEIWVETAGRMFPCLSGLARPDVALARKVPALRNAGFICRFPARRDVTHVRVLGGRGGGRELNLGEYRADRSAMTAPSARALGDYTWWLHANEPRLFWADAEIPKRLRALSRRPLISVVLPTHNTGLYHLYRCVDSVVAQHYVNWELCITDDGSSDAAVRRYLLELADADTRIRVTFSDKCRGISAASNQSLAAAGGEFVVLLDHDDELHPHALLEVARCLDAHPDADLVYSDEDKIDQAGVRSYPAFKPDFDEDMFWGYAYLGHLVAMRTERVRRIGGFRSEADGAQDWDLLLRLTTSMDRSRIRHVPKPLYHWRMHAESTALSLDAKPYAVRAWQRVLEGRLSESPGCTVTDGLFLGSMRVRRRLPDETRVSILYRARDGVHQRRALDRTRQPRVSRFFEVLLSSIRPADAPASSALQSWGDLRSDVTIVIGAALDGVSHQCLQELVAQALRDDCGIVGGLVLGGDGRIVSAGLVALSDGTLLNPFEGLPSREGGYMGQAKVVRAVAAIESQVFAFRTSRLGDVGGLALMTEDTVGELSAALSRSAHRDGLKVLYTPYAVATVRRAFAPAFRPRQRDGIPRHLTVNLNLESFPNVTAVYKAGLG